MSAAEISSEHDDVITLNIAAEIGLFYCLFYHYKCTLLDSTGTLLLLIINNKSENFMTERQSNMMT